MKILCPALAATLINLLPNSLATAEEAKPKWQPVPGHKDVFVDMASIQPLEKRFAQPRPPRGVTPPPGYTYELTFATVKLNGRIHTSSFVFCSGMLSHESTLLDEGGREIGKLPEEAIRGVVCPKARNLVKGHRN